MSLIKFKPDSWKNILTDFMNHFLFFTLSVILSLIIIVIGILRHTTVAGLRYTLVTTCQILLINITANLVNNFLKIDSSYWETRTKFLYRRLIITQVVALFTLATKLVWYQVYGYNSEFIDLIGAMILWVYDFVLWGSMVGLIVVINLIFPFVTLESVPLKFFMVASMAFLWGCFFEIATKIDLLWPEGINQTIQCLGTDIGKLLWTLLPTLLQVYSVNFMGQIIISLIMRKRLHNPQRKFYTIMLLLALAIISIVLQNTMSTLMQCSTHHNLRLGLLQNFLNGTLVCLQLVLLFVTCSQCRKKPSELNLTVNELEQIWNAKNKVFLDFVESEDAASSPKIRETCCICLLEFDKLQKLKLLQCGHVLHHECYVALTSQLAKQAVEDFKCPICRAKFEANILPPDSEGEEGENSSVDSEA